MRKHAYLYHVVRKGPKGGRLLRWGAYGDTGDRIAEFGSRKDIEWLLQMHSYTHVTTIPGLLREATLAMGQANVKMVTA